MNVAIFTDNDFDKITGVTTTLTAALRHAPPSMRLRIYTAADLPVDTPGYLALRSPGVPIPFYAEMRMFVPRLFEYVNRAREDRIDVVHLTTPGPVGLAALYVAWRLGLPMVGSFHTDLAAYTRLLSGSPRLGALMREYLRWPYGKCSRVLVPSEHTRLTLIDARCAPDRLEVWPRGVDAELFQPSRRSTALRAAWRVSDRQLALLYVGRLSREKGLALLRPLGDRLWRLGVEHRFVLAGRGPFEDDLRRAMPDAVFTGALSREAVAEVFASADAFVFPSRTDTAGNVVLEAQASGLPVVIAGDGGVREQIIAGVTGLVCRRDDPAEWAGAIASLTGARARRAEMGAAARQHAVERSWEVALRPLYRAYAEAATRPLPERRGPLRAAHRA